MVRAIGCTTIARPHRIKQLTEGVRCVGPCTRGRKGEKIMDNVWGDFLKIIFITCIIVIVTIIVIVLMHGCA
jgi:hypothetical protein